MLSTLVYTLCRNKNSLGSHLRQLCAGDPAVCLKTGKPQLCEAAGSKIAGTLQSTATQKLYKGKVFVSASKRKPRRLCAHGGQGAYALLAIQHFEVEERNSSRAQGARALKSLLLGPRAEEHSFGRFRCVTEGEAVSRVARRNPQVLSLLHNPAPLLGITDLIYKNPGGSAKGWIRRKRQPDDVGTTSFVSKMA